MLSKANLRALQAEAFHYVVGARLKQLNKADQQAIKAWRPATAGAAEFEVNGRRLLVSYSPARAAHDAEDRMKQVTKLRKRFERQMRAGKDQAPASAGVKAKDLLIGNRGYQRFLTVAGDYQISIYEAKLREAEAWDGLHAVYIRLPETAASASAMSDLYRGLWQVEAAFRVTKHDLQVRPMYHWKALRIEAHVAIAFVCLTLARVLSYRVKVQQRTAMSEARIRAALHKTEVAIVGTERDTTRYALPMPLTTDARKLYKVLNLLYRNEPFVIDWASEADASFKCSSPSMRTAM